MSRFPRRFGGRSSTSIVVPHRDGTWTLVDQDGDGSSHFTRLTKDERNALAHGRHENNLVLLCRHHSEENIKVEVVETFTVEREVRYERRLALPPGMRLRSALAFVFTRKMMTSVFEPVLADIQHEWQEAMIARADTRVRWIRWRGYLLILLALLAYAAAAVREVWKPTAK